MELMIRHDVNVISMGGQDDKRPGSATQKYLFFLMDQNVF
jgi:hypothetical protein